jgi:hypothetical protein
MNQPTKLTKAKNSENLSRIIPNPCQKQNWGQSKLIYYPLETASASGKMRALKTKPKKQQSKFDDLMRLVVQVKPEPKPTKRKKK